MGKLLTEVLHIEKAMLAYAAQRCLSDEQTDDGSGPTTQRLDSSEFVNVVQLINQSFLLPVEIGYSTETTLPLPNTPQNAVSRNTDIQWQFVGWEQSRAIVVANGVRPKWVSQLLRLYPLSQRQSETSVELIMTPARLAHQNPQFAYLSAELLYSSDHELERAEPNFLIEKQSCFL